MLNITENKLNKPVDLSRFKSGKRAFQTKYFKRFNRFLLGFVIVLFLIMFLPWTQTVRGTGYVTTLQPDHRPQTIQSAIPGRIEKWFVQEGDFVNKGDTILHISEVQNQFFDPLLIERTGSQLLAKENSVVSYIGKVGALNSQIAMINNERNLKIEQARNKLQQARYTVQSDSIEVEAAKINLNIAKAQFERISQLQQEGLRALPDVEAKEQNFQESQARVISQQNRLLASENEIINAQIEINRIHAEYNDRILKTESDMFTAQSSQFDAEAQVSKLENDFSNFTIRNDLYFILAPQSGYINKALRAGIGETFKEGERLVGIMPSDFNIAVETYVKPLDIPLIHTGEKVRIQFDGWPAIVFSGWENMSYGTYGAKVVAVENFISENGLFRVLLAPDPDDNPWPKEIRIGSGATTLALLEDVPIWYELWRQLNGFPSNYYKPTQNASVSEK